MLGLLSTGASLVEPLIYREAINDVAGLFVRQARENAQKDLGLDPEETEAIHSMVQEETGDSGAVGNNTGVGNDSGATAKDSATIGNDSAETNADSGARASAGEIGERAEEAGAKAGVTAGSKHLTETRPAVHNRHKHTKKQTHVSRPPVKNRSHILRPMLRRARRSRR